MAPFKMQNGRYVATRAERAKGIEICAGCGKIPTIMVFRGTGVCSDDCRKKRDGDDVKHGRH